MIAGGRGGGQVFRVLRPGGRFAATSWETLQTPFRKAWYSVAAFFVSEEAIEDAAQRGVPSEDLMADAGNCFQVFRDAGFANVEIERRHYTSRMGIADFLAYRESATGQGRFVRQQLDDGKWEEFRAAATAEFRQRFPDPSRKSGTC